MSESAPKTPEIFNIIDNLDSENPNIVETVGKDGQARRYQVGEDGKKTRMNGESIRERRETVGAYAAALAGEGVVAVEGLYPAILQQLHSGELSPEDSQLAVTRLTEQARAWVEDADHMEPEKVLAVVDLINNGDVELARKYKGHEVAEIADAARKTILADIQTNSTAANYKKAVGLRQQITNNREQHQALVKAEADADAEFDAAELELVRYGGVRPESVEYKLRVKRGGQAEIDKMEAEANAELHRRANAYDNASANLTDAMNAVDASNVEHNMLDLDRSRAMVAAAAAAGQNRRITRTNPEQSAETAVETPQPEPETVVNAPIVDVQPPKIPNFTVDFESDFTPETPEELIDNPPSVHGTRKPELSKPNLKIIEADDRQGRRDQYHKEAKAAGNNPFKNLAASGRDLRRRLRGLANLPSTVAEYPDDSYRNLGSSESAAQAAGSPAEKKAEKRAEKEAAKETKKQEKATKKQEKAKAKSAEKAQEQTDKQVEMEARGRVLLSHADIRNIISSNQLTDRFDVELDRSTFNDAISARRALEIVDSAYNAGEISGRQAKKAAKAINGLIDSNLNPDIQVDYQQPVVGQVTFDSPKIEAVTPQDKRPESAPVSQPNATLESDLPEFLR